MKEEDRKIKVGERRPKVKFGKKHKRRRQKDKNGGSTKEDK